MCVVTVRTKVTEFAVLKEKMEQSHSKVRQELQLKMLGGPPLGQNSPR